MKKILLLISMMLILSGCNTNYNSLNDLAIVSSMIIDVKDGKYKTYIELYKQEKSENKSKKTSYFIEGTGSTIKNAINDASLTISKDLYFTHINAVIFSKEAVDGNLKSLFNYLEKRIDLNSNYYILVSDNIKELMDVSDKDNPILGEKIRGIITYSTNNGALVEYDFLDKLYNYVNPKIDVFLNKIEVKDDYALVENAYVFKKEKIVDSLDGKEIKITNLLKDNGNIYFNFGKDKDYFEIKIDKCDSKVTYEDNIKIQLNIKATLDSLGDNLNLNPESVSKMNKQASSSLKRQIEDLIEKIKSDKADIFGINNEIYKKFGYQKYDLFKNNVDVKVNVVISKKGLILDTIGG